MSNLQSVLVPSSSKKPTRSAEMKFENVRSAFSQSSGLGGLGLVPGVVVLSLLLQASEGAWHRMPLKQGDKVMMTMPGEGTTMVMGSMKGMPGGDGNGMAKSTPGNMSMNPGMMGAMSMLMGGDKMQKSKEL